MSTFPPINRKTNRSNTSDTQFLQQLHRFVVALAGDLEKDFYQHFDAFLQRLFALLRTQDADQLEWTCICLAHLTKNLKRFLKDDIRIVFNAIMPLLDRRQPEHITNFAAECFSFVARDCFLDRTDRRTLDLLLGALRQHAKGVAGCGRLLYEMMRGIGGQLHSCTDAVLRQLFGALRKPDRYDGALLHEVLTEMTLNLLYSTNAEAMAVFWQALLGVLDGVLKEEEARAKEVAVDNTAETTLLVRRLLSLMGQAVEFRRGKMVNDNTVAVIAALKRMLRLPIVYNDAETLSCVGQLIAACLLCTNLTVSQADASELCLNMLSVAKPMAAAFEEFVWNMRAYPQFTMLVLREFVQYYEKELCVRPSVQSVLCRIVAEKSPPCRDGLNVAGWTRFGLQFKHKATADELLRRIVGAELQATEDDEELLNALLVWPHCLGVDVAKVRQPIGRLIREMCDTFGTSSLTVPRKLTLLAGLIETVSQCQTVVGAIAAAEWTLPVDALVSTLLPFCTAGAQPPQIVHAALAIVDQFVAGLSDEHITYELFRRLHAAIGGNLAAEFHRVRLLSAHILARFGKLPQLRGNQLVGDDADAAPLTETVYDICVAVESITAGVTTYRDQLMALARLAADQRLYQSVRQTVCAADALRYLLGALYINFKLLWKPIVDIVATFAAEMPVSEFWPVFRAQLEAVVGRIRKPPAATAFDVDFDELWQCADRPDYVNYRVLLWRALPEFGQLTEVRNRDVVQLLMDFVEQEYRRSHENEVLCWNVLQAPLGMNGEGADAEETDAAMEVDAVVDYDDLDDDESTHANGPSGAAHKGTQKTLMAILSVFTKLANPSQIYRHADVYALFMELLTHRNAHIQKLALDCIMAHRHKYLQPYREHLYGIIDEVKFKEAVQGFKIDVRSEENVVQPEHRADLMAFLVRILYSKLTAKAQKGGGQARKALVMRFLGQCSEAEVVQLLRMAFAVYEQWLRSDEPESNVTAVQLVDTILGSVRLEAVLSPKKLQSSLNLLEIIREQFGGLMGAQFQRYLLRVLFAVGGVVEAVLRRGDAVNAAHAKHFKHLRTVCQQTVAKFCEHIDTYPWQEDEVQALFRLFVWPQMARLPAEGIHATTPLLKLFVMFAKNPRYFGLFARVPSDGVQEDCSPLRYIIDLLLEPKTKPLVCLSVMELIQNLLQLADPQPNVDPASPPPPPPLPTGSCRQIHRPAILGDINLGSALLLPYLPQILTKFQQNVQKRRGLTRRDLHIVSMCTRLVTDAATSERLLSVLLKILVRKTTAAAASNETELQQAIETIHNLFARVDDPGRHVRSIAPMFGNVSEVGPRKQLCDLLEMVAKRMLPTSAAYQRTSEVVRGLNAWDARWIQQPDHVKRSAAFDRLAELQKAGQMDLDLCLLAVYHSFYFVRHEKDLGLVGRATDNLRTMLPAMVRQLQAAGDAVGLDHLLGDVVLNLLRRTIVDSVETVRREGILLLGELAREVPDAHPVLQDLGRLASKQDMEVDFFENLVHLQRSRHGGALSRFCAVARQLERRPLPRTLTQFVLPLASHYVWAERHNLVKEATEAVGVVANLLPWHQYEALLKYYLKKLRYDVEHQKQLVQLVMKILDAFHFDMSRAKVAKGEVVAELEKVVVVEKKEGEDGEDEDGEDEEVEKVVKIAVVEGEEAVVLGDAEAPTAEDELDDEFVRQGDDGDDEEVETVETTTTVGLPAAKPRLPAVAQPIVLTHKAAKRLIHNIATGLIPQLNNVITTISTYDNYHKLNKKQHRSEREEEEMKRVPIALAMVKLLQKLPDGMLDHTLPGIMMKICQFLKSPVRSVRSRSREILQKVMLTVGTKYLDTLLQQMTALLTRGFQVCSKNCSLTQNVLHKFLYQHKSIY